MYWGNTADTDILRQQIETGSCQMGSSPGYCLMADGSEAGCNVIRECQPQLHFEYALPGQGSGNVNIWQYYEDNKGQPVMIWNGPAPAPNPSAAPAIQRDPFDPNHWAPVVNYESMFTASLPPVTLPPANSYPPAAGGGATVAESFQGGLLDILRQQAMAKYGRTSITQMEYCALPAFANFANKPCSVMAPQGGAMEVSAWLAIHQQAESTLVSSVGNRPGLDYSQGPAAGGGGSGLQIAPGGSQGGGLGGGVGLLLVAGLAFMMFRK